MEFRKFTTDQQDVIFRIAHISDTHVSPEYNRQNIFKLRALLSQVVDENFDHVVITGDIAGHGEERDFRSVRRLLKYFDLLKYDKLTVTIGNHDIFGGVHRAEDLFSFSKHCRSVDYAGKIDLFEKAFKETFPKKAYENERAFPFVKFVGPVVFVGINSVRPFHPFLNPVGSNGHVSHRQLQAVERFLGHPSLGDLKRIVLVHHHFNRYEPFSDSLGSRLFHAFEGRTLKLHGMKQVEKVFEELGVEAVLHGHTHIEKVYYKAGITYSSTAMNTVREKNKKDLGESNGSIGTDFLKTTSGLNEVTVSSDKRIAVRRLRYTNEYSKSPEESPLQ